MLLIHQDAKLALRRRRRLGKLNQAHFQRVHFVQQFKARHRQISL
jgi:hypothetical protein